MNSPDDAQEIHFRSFNPYEVIFPGRRVVSGEALRLIKDLRSQGYRVVVDPDDGSRLNYTTEKGLYELLTNPIVMQIIGIPISFIVNLLASATYERVRGTPREVGTRVAISFDEQGRSVHYDQSGEPLSDEQFRMLLKSLDERARRFGEAVTTTPPDIERPAPLYLEHTDKIVGWAHLSVDELGLHVDSGAITDDDTWRRIESGELKGLSIAGLIASSTCSVCHGEYVECNHIASRVYDGHECTVRIRPDIAEISIVREPINPVALLQVKVRADDLDT